MHHLATLWQFRRPAPILVALAVLLPGAGCAIGKAVPSGPEMAADTVALEAVLPVIDELQLTAYRNQDWCKNLAYRRGAFSNNSESSTCDLFEGRPEPFDADAQTDFDRIARALANTSVSVIWVDVGPWMLWNTGRPIKFAVVTRAIGAQYWSYVYEPGYELPVEPAGPEGEIELVPIDDNWYFEWEEWM